MIKKEIDTEIYLKMGDFDEDGGKMFRETLAKQSELLLCIIGQEMPLINGKRRKFDNIEQGSIYYEYGFESTWDMNISILSILEKEWGYAKIKYGEEYGSSK